MTVCNTIGSARIPAERTKTQQETADPPSPSVILAVTHAGVGWSWTNTNTCAESIAESLVLSKSEFPSFRIIMLLDV